MLIVGTNETSIELANEVALRGKWGWKMAGLIEPGLEACDTGPRELDGHPVLGCARDIAKVAIDTRANRVIVVSPIALRELVEGLVLADEVRVRVDVVPELYEIFIGTVDAIVGDVPLMEITRSPVPRYYAAAKRGLDLFGSALLFVIASPVLLVAVIAAQPRRMIALVDLFGGHRADARRPDVNQIVDVIEIVCRLLQEQPLGLVLVPIPGVKIAPAVGHVIPRLHVLDRPDLA